jgi:AraC family transcriptional regulator
MSASAPALLPSRSLLERVREYILQNLDEPLKGERLARMLKVSRSTLCRSWRATYGESLHSFILRSRIERACTLLNKEEKSLVEIALDCGFSHQSHFTHALVKYVGMTPLQVRNAARFRKE